MQSSPKWYVYAKKCFNNCCTVILEGVTTPLTQACVSCLQFGPYNVEGVAVYTARRVRAVCVCCGPRLVGILKRVPVSASSQV